MRALIVIVVLVVMAAVFVGASMFIVQEGQQVVITQFGRPVKTVTEAGLNFKTPFIQTVHRLEKRLLPWDGEPEQMPTRDKKQIFIDVWARWRIVDPMKFFQALRTEQRGYGILDNLVDSAVRNVVGKYNLIEAVRSSNDPLVYETEELAKDYDERREHIIAGRAKMEAEMLADVTRNDLRQQYGMELTNVHIKRINYVEKVRLAVYDRMKSERLRIAELLNSEAKEEKYTILGRMQEELEQIEGQMRQQSTEVRGAADAEVIGIAADGYGKSPEFYDFLRSLEAYKTALSRGTRLILSTDNKFLQHLQSAGTEDKNTP